jgi:hypothetical protein
LGVGANALLDQSNTTCENCGEARYASARASSDFAPDLRAATSCADGPSLVRSRAILRRHATGDIGCGFGGSARAVSGERTAAARIAAKIVALIGFS